MYGYRIKTKYANLAIFSFLFPSLLATKKPVLDGSFRQQLWFFVGFQTGYISMSLMVPIWKNGGKNWQF
jgi:hypothetical protein